MRWFHFVRCLRVLSDLNGPLRLPLCYNTGTYGENFAFAFVTRLGELWAPYEIGIKKVLQEIHGN